MKHRVKLILRVAAAILPLISLAFVPWGLVWAWSAPLPDTVQEQVNNAIDHGMDGIIVYVDQGGQEPAFYTAGWKNKENQIPADPQALFKIASISKLYVAVAITKLVNDQRMSLDDTLTDFYPELAGRIEYEDKITLRMMLQHRSGIPNLTDHPDYPWPDPPKSAADSLKFALDLPADFKPGAKYRYSNTNYLLLSEIIGQVVGYSHHQYIKEEILIPLNLNHTFSSLYEVDLDDVVSGYYVGWGPDIKKNIMSTMVATAEDVGIFLRALNDGSLLSEEEQAIYSTVYKFEHTGLLPGYSSIARYHEDIDTVVIQFINTSGAKTWSMTEIIYNRIVKILRKE